MKSRIQKFKKAILMKPYNFIVTFLLLIFFVSSAMTEATVSEYTKKINKEFNVNADALTSIQNKYGNVEIISSNRSSVKFEITILVEARNQDRADELFSKIDVDFSASSSRVSAITEFEKQNKNWNWGKNNENYQVHYRVELPNSNRLDVDNKYGNVSVTDMNADVKLTLKYGNGNLQNIGGDFQGEIGYAGNCDLGAVGGNVDLQIAYSGFSVESAVKGFVQSKYSKMEFGRIDALTIESKYDKYSIESVGVLTNEGKYDNFSIESAHSLSFNTKYTHIKVEELSHSGRFDTGYGSVKVRDLGSAFSAIDITSRYTGFELGTSGGYDLDLDSEYTKTNLPSDLSIKYRDKDSNKLKLKGSFKGGGGSIKAVMGYGNLDLRGN